MTKGKNPMKNLRGRMEFTRAETHDAPSGAQPGNPWEKMLLQDEGAHRPRRHVAMDFVTIAVLLFVGGVIIGVVLAMRG